MSLLIQWFLISFFHFLPLRNNFLLLKSLLCIIYKKTKFCHNVRVSPLYRARVDEGKSKKIKSVNIWLKCQKRRKKSNHREKKNETFVGGTSDRETWLKKFSKWFFSALSDNRSRSKSYGGSHTHFLRLLSESIMVNVDTSRAIFSVNCSRDPLSGLANYTIDNKRNRYQSNEKHYRPLKHISEIKIRINFRKQSTIFRCVIQNDK